MRSRILIIGTLPQTAGIGGVTIHVDRLVKWLEKESYPVDLCDYKRLSYWKQLKLIWQHKILHIHVSNPFLRVFYVGLSILFFKKSILTIHGDIGRFGRVKNLVDSIAIKLCTILITINRHSYDIGRDLNKNTRLVSAFLAPVDEGFIPQDVVYILEKLKKKGSVIFSTNASCRKINQNGQEVYGIDFLVDYFNKHSQYNLIISDSSGEYGAYYQKNQIRIQENIILISQPHSFLKVLNYSDIMIRNTQTDGDALSVKEALYFKKNVFASNCVDRPSGVFLFKYNNKEDFERLIQQSNKIIAGQPVFHIEDVVDQIIKIYNELQK